MHRVKAIISGVVQGVGFRPFIYQLAHRHRLAGYVINTSKGVEIEVEGKKEDIHAFLKTIAKNSPPLALITSIKTYPLTPQVPCNDGGISLGQAMKVALLSRKN